VSARSTPASLDEHLGFRVAAAGRMLRASADTALAPLGIAAPAFGVLLRLSERDGLSQAELARHQAVEAPSMCRMVDRLERDDLVERRRDGGDRRVVRVHLTDRGRAAISEGNRALAPHESRIASALAPDERRLLLDLLDRLNARMGSGR
jgi:DNA-binding MarR family transcriptional regulator